MTQMSLNPEVNLDQQIQDVLDGKGKRRLENHERLFLGLVRYCKGTKNARPLSFFANNLMLSDRQVKATAKELVETFNLPIGASRQEPYGYYLCVTADDIEQAAKPLESEFFSLARRIRKLRGKERFRELLGQLRLETGEVAQ